MGIFEKFKKEGTKLVGSYKGDVKGSALEYPTSEINGVSDGKGFITGGESINSTIAKKPSTLHKEASTLNTPEVKAVLTDKSYSQKYQKTALNKIVPDASTIDEGSTATFIAPSSPSVKGRNINTTKDAIPSYSSVKTYKSLFEKDQLTLPRF
jgi:hypothetical protein